MEEKGRKERELWSWLVAIVIVSVGFGLWRWGPEGLRPILWDVWIFFAVSGLVFIVIRIVRWRRAKLLTPYRQQNANLLRERNEARERLRLFSGAVLECCPNLAAAIILIRRHRRAGDKDIGAARRLIEKTFCELIPTPETQTLIMNEGGGIAEKIRSGETSPE